QVDIHFTQGPAARGSWAIQFFPPRTRHETWGEGPAPPPSRCSEQTHERESYRLPQTAACDAEGTRQKAGRPDSARASVSWSASPRSPPTGRRWAGRVTATPSVPSALLR